MSSHPTHGRLLTAQDMMATYYGVPLTYIGEDGENTLALGHVAARRFIAASRKLARTEDVGDWVDTLAEALTLISYHWAINLPACPSPNADGCPGERMRCLPPELAEENPWWVLWDDDSITSETPGAFPVTIGEWGM